MYYIKVRMHLFVRLHFIILWCDEDDDDRMPEQMGDTYLTNKTIQLKHDIFPFRCEKCLYTIYAYT